MLSTTIEPIAALCWLFVVVLFTVVGACEEAGGVLSTTKVVVVEEIVLDAGVDVGIDEGPTGTVALFREVEEAR